MENRDNFVNFRNKSVVFLFHERFCETAEIWQFVNSFFDVAFHETRNYHVIFYNPTFLLSCRADNDTTLFSCPDNIDSDKFLAVKLFV